MGRTASGVRGISLREDEVVAMTVVRPGGTLPTVTENGFGKHTAPTQMHTVAGTVLICHDLITFE